MIEMQKLCDKVPAFDSKVAFALIEEEYAKRGLKMDNVFSYISQEPVAAASLGQVYVGRLTKSGLQVAVKVQRPFVVENVSLDLFLLRNAGTWLLKIPFFYVRTNVVELLDEFAQRFFDELDYELECVNGEKIRKQLSNVQNIKIPVYYQSFTTRRVLVCEWITGEKLSQSASQGIRYS